MARRGSRLAALLLAGVLAAAPVPGTELGEARKLAAARQFAPALELYDRLVAAEPDDDELAIERARVLGYADRNAAAADAWRDIAERFPARRTEVLPAWAWQTLWAGDETAAVPLFEEALVLSTADPHERFGLAQALNYSGRHRAAAGEFATLLPSTDAALLLHAARAHYWAAFSDQAEPLLAGTTLPVAQWLRDYRIGRELRPYVSGDFEFADDSDELRIVAASTAAGWRLTGHDTLELSLRSAWLDGPDTRMPLPAPGSADGQQFLLTWSTRRGDIEPGGAVIWPSLSVGWRDYGEWRSFAWRARARIVPRDGITLTASAGNGPVETIGAIRNRIEYTEAALGAELRPHPRWLIAAGATRLDFDGGNTRNQATLRAEYLAHPPLRLRLGIDGLQFSNDRPTGPARPDQGYWNPDRYRELRLYTSLSVERGAWSFDARLATGWYDERSGWGDRSSGALLAAEAAAGCDLSPALRLRLYAGAADSGSGFGGGGRGYRRVYGGIGLTGYF
ncbi:MAG: hypothetical protein FJ191_00680 [Gammaproteobacteria bacterium]|nr:hypothetical protein [Gammaproteobacteria bacterium]